MKNSIHARRLAAVLAVAGTAAAAQAATPAPVRELVPVQAQALSAALAAHIDPVLQAALQEQRIVGGVVIVAQQGRVLYRKAVGWADREAREPMATDTVFRLASVSKPIVSVVAMRLVEQGRLELDAPVTAYLPYFRPALADGRVPAITVRQLLTHTAGLGYGFAEGSDGAYARLGISDGLDDSGLSLEENLRRLAKSPLYFEPGSQWRYSLSIDVLGAVVAQAGGQPLPQAVHALVTQPLGMRHTGFVAKAGDRLATPYADGKPAPVRMFRNMEVPLPAGLGGALRFAPQRAYDPRAFASGGAGMVGTAGDFLRLMEMVRRGGGTLLQPQTVAAMARDQVGPQAQTQGPGWGFGYGWAVLDDPAAARTPQSRGTLQWGGAYGHHWFIDPARGLSVVLLTNTTFEGMAGRLVPELRDAVYAGLAQE
jgi:CubicO group peptidase (beta-lactamase class C family)